MDPYETHTRLTAAQLATLGLPVPPDSEED